MKRVETEFSVGDVVCEIGRKSRWRVEEAHSNGFYYFTTLGYNDKKGIVLFYEDADERYVKVGNVDLGDW